MLTKTATSLSPEEIEKMEALLDKKPIGQDKLVNAKKLAEKGVLTLENIAKVAKKTKK
jgi:hypothetical protein